MYSSKMLDYFHSRFASKKSEYVSNEDETEMHICFRCSPSKSPFMDSSIISGMLAKTAI